MMDLDALQLAEAFFAADPKVLSLVQCLLFEAIKRWPSLKIVTQKRQVGLSDPHPFCALYPPRKAADRKAHALGVSLFLGRPLDAPQFTMSVEAYPGRFTNHMVLRNAEELTEEFWLWLEEARQFRNS